MAVTSLGTANGRPYDIVAVAVQSPYVQHLALNERSCVLTAHADCHVFDIGPPLHISSSVPLRAHIHATLDLSVDETKMIGAWLADMASQVLPEPPGRKLANYLWFPHAVRSIDAVTGQPTGWRFSCAGLVYEAYLACGISLVNLATLSVDAAQCCATWGLKLSDAIRLNTMHGLGLTGTGPWALLLPSHIVHAVAAGRDALPFATTKLHATYP